MLDAEVGAELIELVPPGGLAFAQTEQTIGEFLTPRHCLSDQWRSNVSISQDRPDPDGAAPFQIAQEPAGNDGCHGFAYAADYLSRLARAGQRIVSVIQFFAWFLEGSAWLENLL